ncbi:sulfotransferase family 2 domain-containing protein [uncultured Xanthomonas sp.]|uniref:sulfotransferase family 2 domain-containing protein n=1 Tax=uncultured Xanthomonas sp. TaxID=152831 RepID=UPI0025CE775A|nr:sulfotransferase family 2 domain-containing protein [uncultured Xanthomonas sp.]
MWSSSAAQDVPKPQEALYFLHIPKTAGTTLSAFLDAQYTPAQICPSKLLPELFAMDRCSLRERDYRFFRGHLWNGLERYVQQPLRYLTMLRDPLRRTLSWYAHVRRDPRAYRHEQMVRENWSFLDFVTDPDTRWDLVNTQVLYLAADLDFEQLAADPVGYGRRTIRAYAERGNDPALLEVAKSRLRSMEFGICERMGDSLMLFSYLFGFDTDVPMHQLNVSPGRISDSALSAEVRAAVDKVTELDRQLYEWAKQVFAERFSAMAATLVMKEARRLGHAGRIWRVPLQAASLARIGVAAVLCPAQLAADTSATVEVMIRNDSDELLSSRPPCPVHVSYHWVDANSGDTIVYDGERTVLPAAIGPNECLSVTARVRAPSQPGRFKLQPRLVQEGVRWIGEDCREHDQDVLVLAG